MIKISIHLKAIPSDISIQNSQHRNPLRRVALIDSINQGSQGLSYDKEKYKEMILDAAETVLGYSGLIGPFMEQKKVTGPRKWRWLQELKEEREKDIRTEIV